MWKENRLDEVDLFQPPPLPDLWCLDYYLWSYIKQLVYSDDFNDTESLMERIDAAMLIMRQSL